MKFCDDFDTEVWAFEKEYNMKVNRSVMKNVNVKNENQNRLTGTEGKFAYSNIGLVSLTIGSGILIRDRYISR
jgi:hypothetical protein